MDDPNFLSNYEVVHETLSAEESDAEIESTSDDKSLKILPSTEKKKTKKRKIVKNFVICQPLGKNKRIRKETKDQALASKVVNFVDEGGPSISTVEKLIKETIDKVLQEDLPANVKDLTSIWNITKHKCPYCKFITLSRFCFKKHVALHENKVHLVFTQGILEKTCNSNPTPNLKLYQCSNCYDLFRTDTGIKYHKPCIKPDEIYLDKSEKQVEEKDNIHPENSEQPKDPKYEEPAIIAALKCLNKKSIDFEMAKESLNDLISSDLSSVQTNKDDFMKMIFGRVIEKSINAGTSISTNVPTEISISFENGQPFLSNVEKKIKTEIMDEESSISDEIKMEPYHIEIENVKLEDVENEIEDEINYNSEESNNAVNYLNTEYDVDKESTENNEEFPIEFKYNDLPRVVIKGNPLRSNNQAPFTSGREVKDVTVLTQNEVRRLDNCALAFGPPKPFSPERIRFNQMIDDWKKSYKTLYPNLTARVHVPGGIRCPDCQTFYQSFHLLKRHWARIHDPGLSVISCPLCDYKTNQKELLNSHFKLKHVVKSTYVCDKCDKTFHQSGKLMKHKLLHHSDKSRLPLFKCDQCNYSSFDRACLRSHIEKRHVRTGFLCMYCGLFLKSDVTIKRHEKMHLGITKIFNCKNCAESFEHRMDLVSHEHVAHANLPIYFNCDSCEYNTLCKEQLVVHNNTTHLQVKQFKCSDCSLTLKDFNSLKEHITRKHNPYISWKYCANCSYKTLLKNLMANHVLKHLPRKSAPIKCKSCSYRTYNRYYYQRHYNTRHNPNAVIYECFHCGYTNKVKAKLHQHVQEKGHILT